MMIKEYKTTNPFIAAVCDQAGEVIALEKPTWTGPIKSPTTFDAIDADEKIRGPQLE